MRRVLSFSLLAAGTLAAARSAQAQTAAPQVSLPDITVVGSTPLPASGLDRSQIPASTQVLGSQDINRTGIPSLTGAILDNVPSVTINDVEGNPFQPDLLFRGFTSSPTAGAAQGLAVYVNGARFNDSFGDTVNWDLIPSSAIDTVNLEAANPVFGLNALGGSVSVQLKNGFTYHGASLTAYGGSYERGSGVLEYGREFGNFAVYATGEITHDGGYRQTSASDIYRLYTDLGWRNDTTELHLGITAADNTLGNPGATPVQALNADISNIFTAPNEVYNKYVGVNLNGTTSLNDSTSLQAVAYFQNLTQRVPNGITEEIAPCEDESGLLCTDDGSIVTDTHGKPVPDYLHGATYSGLSVQGLDSHAYGASAQITNDTSIAGHKNHLVLGASFDGADSDFTGSQALGGFDPISREFLYPAITLDIPDAGINPVHVATTTRFYSLFVSDVLTLVPGVDLTLAGRFNNAQVDLDDKLGGPVRGQHSYNRFNPSIGLTWQAAPWVQFFGRYAETNRVPTPQELSCASPENPCTLLNFFVGDPNLKQVVAHSFEAGARGRLNDIAGGRIGWNVDYYYTKNFDDLIYTSTAFDPNLNYFTNAGKTVRQGVEASLRYDTAKLHASLGYAYTDATFKTPLVLNSLSNPAADANGQIQVQSGDRIPGVPRHRGTAMVSYALTDRWTLGGSAILQDSQYRFGDEANLTKPVGGYVIVNLNTAYRITDNITVFGLVNNLFDKRYDTYGSFGPVGDVTWPNVPGGVTDTRTASPGTPIAGYGGVKVTF